MNILAPACRTKYFKSEAEAKSWSDEDWIFQHYDSVNKIATFLPSDL